MIRQLFEKIFHRQAPWFERYFMWLLVGAAVMAMAICLAIGLGQSVWFDEAYSIMLAKQPVGELIHLTSVDTHPPFYYLLLKAWAGLFGWGELALRSLSVLAMGGAVMVAGLFVRRFFGVRAALLTLPFVVIAPFLLRYGFEIRMYALASLVGIAATYVLAIAVESKGRRQWWLYAFYALLVTLGVLTLYYIVLLWVVHLVWLIGLARHKRESVRKQRWWLAYLASFLLFLPWLVVFLGQLGNGALAPISQQMTVENLVGVVSFMFLYQPSWQLNGWTSLLIVAVIGVLIYVVPHAFKSVSKHQKPYYVLVVLYALLPIALIAFISLARPMYVERYLAHVLIGLSLLIGVSLWILWQKQPRKGFILAGFLLAIMLLGLGNVAVSGNYNFQRLQKPQVAEATANVKCANGPMVLAADPYTAIELTYYLQPHCAVYFYSEMADLKGGYAPLANSPLRVADLESRLLAFKEVTVVYYDELKVPMPTSLKPIEMHSYGPLHVATYSVDR